MGTCIFFVVFVTDGRKGGDTSFHTLFSGIMLATRLGKVGLRKGIRFSSWPFNFGNVWCLAGLGND